MRWVRIAQQGFTIVELLIVIVVIAILAAITIVSYNGIQGRAKTAALDSSVTQWIKKVESLKIQSGTETLPDVATLAIPSGSGVTYYLNGGTNTYCIQAVNGSTVRSGISTQSTPVDGACVVNGLLGQWRFNGNANDSSPNQLNATMSNVVNAVGQNGVANNAYAFNGTNSGGSVSDTESRLTFPYTFSFWINPTAWSSTAATAFIAKRTAGEGPFIMYLTSASSFAVDCGGGASRWASNGIAPPLNQWSHYVVVCTGETVTAFQNGIQFGTASRQASITLANSQPIEFGVDRGTYRFTGSMDDIRVYNRALSAGEAQVLFNEGAR